VFQKILGGTAEVNVGHDSLRFERAAEVVNARRRGFGLKNHVENVVGQTQEIFPVSIFTDLASCFKLSVGPIRLDGASSFEFVHRRVGYGVKARAEITANAA